MNYILDRAYYVLILRYAWVATFQNCILQHIIVFWQSDYTKFWFVRQTWILHQISFIFQFYDGCSWVCPSRDSAFASWVFDLLISWSCTHITALPNTVASPIRISFWRHSVTIGTNMTYRNPMQYYLKEMSDFRYLITSTRYILKDLMKL